MLTGSVSVWQIRAEEVSQEQSMLEVRFSAQGLDKKVRPCSCAVSILVLVPAFWLTHLSRTFWASPILTWSLPSKILMARSLLSTAQR